MMARRALAAIALAAMIATSGLAGAQSVGTPGTGPLVPGGPRQGLGSPSLTDSVPDLRLRSSGGGIPGAGPPIGSGMSNAVPIYGDQGSGAGMGAGVGRSSRQARGRHCETPRSTCVLPRAASLGAACSCRGRGNGQRVRGSVAY